MSAEIQLPYSAHGANLYAVMRSAVGTVVKTSDGSLVAYVTANLSQYTIALTEQGTASQFYTASVPSGVAAGIYSVTIYLRAGGSAAEGDLAVGFGTIDWTASQVSSLGAGIPSVSQTGDSYSVITNGFYGLSALGNSISAIASAVLVSSGNLAQTGSTSGTIKLNSVESSVSGFFNGCWVTISSGTGSGQAPRLITAYNGASRVASVTPAWNTTPDTSSVYAVIGRAGVDVETWGAAAVTGMPMPTYSQPTGFLAATFPGTVGSSTLTQTQVTGGAYALNSSSFSFNSALDFTTTQKTSLTSGGAPSAATIADTVLRRTMAHVEASSDGDSLSKNSLYGLIQQGQKWSVSGTTQTVYRTDGTTTLGTFSLTDGAGADPIVGVT